MTTILLIGAVVAYVLVLTLTRAMCKTLANEDDAVERWQR